MSSRKEEMGQTKTPPTSGSAGQANEQAMLTKRRVLDDDVEFISSNPVKRRRLTEQKHGQVAQEPMNPPLLNPPPPPPSPALAPPPPPAPSTPPACPPPLPQVTFVATPATPDLTQTPTVDRRRSMCDANQVKAPRLDSTPETRGKSLPVLERFAFPQPLAPVQTRPPRRSEAISPKQLPQTYRAPPEAAMNINHAFLPTPIPSSENSVTLNQISCLDFNGTSTNTPGFDVSQVFSADGGIMGSVGFGNPVHPVHGPAPLNSTNTHHLVPSMSHLTRENSPLLSIGALQKQNNTKLHVAHRHPATENTAPRQPSSMLTPKSQTSSPCLHCARIRLTQKQALMNPPQIQHPTNQQPNCNPSVGPVHNHNNSLIPHPAPTHPAPTSHPTPPAHPANHPRRHQHHHDQHQHEPTQPSSFSPTHPKPGGPNSNSLLQDIAQTIQASFPYAQVAARQGMAPATVAEVLSSLVVVPLLLRGGSGRFPPRAG